MWTAFVGVLGVVIGGVLTGIVNVAVDRTRRRDRAIVAAAMIQADLVAASELLASVDTAGEWWTLSNPPQLPAWEARGGDFFPGVPLSSYGCVAKANDWLRAVEADVKDRLFRRAQTEKVEARTVPSIEVLRIPVNAKDREKLKAGRQYVQEAIDATKCQKPGLDMRKWAPRAARAAVALAVLGLLVWQLTLP